MVIGGPKHIVKCFRAERFSTEIVTSQLTLEPTTFPSTFAATTTETGTKRVICLVYMNINSTLFLLPVHVCVRRNT